MTVKSEKRSFRHWLYLMGHSPNEKSMELYEFLVASDQELDEFSKLYNPYKDNFMTSLIDFQQKKILECNISYEYFEREYEICPRFALEILIWRPVFDYELKRFEDYIHNDRNKLRAFYDLHNELPGMNLLFYIN